MDFRFDEFEIDLGQQELRRSGQVVRIEPQVFELLVYLVRNSNRIVSKEELIEAVWQGRVISEAALSSCVSAARRAIGDSGKDQLRIRTASKRGFRFVGALDDATPPQTVLADSAACAQESPAAIAVALTQQASAPSALALPDKPSIAVLPFQNMSGDPEQEYFADGLTEDIITGLSRQRWFFVIARNSSFAFKGEAVDVRKVASELGVRYVLEGSVRKIANRVRVTGQLIDAAHGIHLWADKYDRELEDIFKLQDEITNRVIGSVLPQILTAEAAAAFDDLTRSNRDAELVQQSRFDWANTFRTARFIPAVDYINANRVRSTTIEAWDELMKKVDVIVTPTNAANLAQLVATNLTGHPAVILPNGFRPDGTPVSLTFLGGLFEEAKVMAVAHAYQRETGFHNVHPAIPPTPAK